MTKPGYSGHGNYFRHSPLLSCRHANGTSAPLFMKQHVLYVQQKTLNSYFSVSFYLNVQLMKSKNILMLSLSLSLPLLSLPLSLFPLKNSFFIQVVLSHSQHQHLIKPKDKHGPRSTAELISSLGSISQLPSICSNANLLFFTGKKREHEYNAVRSTLLWLFKNMIMQQFVNINYHSLSSVSLPLLRIVITSCFLT